MSNDFYNPSLLTRHTLARSSAVNAQLTAIQSGFGLLPGKDKLNQQRINYYVAGGAADVYTVAMSPTLTAYATGLTLKLQIPASNTGACTINVDSLGAKPVVLFNQATPAAGDLTTGDIYEFLYDGTSFVLLGPARSLMTGLTSLSGNLTFSGDNVFTGDNEFDDDAFALRDNGDATKLARFQLSGLTTATTRTITLADASGTMALIAATQTLTNKTINLSNNTLTGTTAEFNAALSDGSFATLAGTEALTNKTISAASNTLQAFGVGQCYFQYTNTTTCTLVPKNGNLIQIAGTLHDIPDAGATLGTGGLSSTTLYYVYAYDDGGTLTLEASTTAWAVSTTAGNKGMPIKSGDNTRTLVGMLYTDGSTQFTAPMVISYWNPIRRYNEYTEPSTLTTTSTSWVAVGTALYFLYITGLPQPRGVAIGAMKNNGAGLYSYARMDYETTDSSPYASMQGASYVPLSTETGEVNAAQGRRYFQLKGLVGSGEASFITTNVAEFWG